MKDTAAEQQAVAVAYVQYAQASSENAPKRKRDALRVVLTRRVNVLLMRAGLREATTAEVVEHLRRQYAAAGTIDTDAARDAVAIFVETQHKIERGSVWLRFYDPAISVKTRRVPLEGAAAYAEALGGRISPNGPVDRLIAAEIDALGSEYVAFADASYKGSRLHFADGCTVARSA